MDAVPANGIRQTRRVGDPKRVRAPERERAFRSARRHTLVVRVLRVSLPILCAATIGAMSVSTLSFQIPLGNLDIGGIGLDGSTVVMDSPKLSGYRAGRGTYLIEAEKAEQDLTANNIVNLTGLDGRLTQEDGRWATLNAGTGRLDTTEQFLILRDRIILRADGGYRAVLQDAAVDMKAGKVTSDKPVKVDMLNGSLEAERMIITESGRTMSFDGRVQLRVILGVPSGPLPGVRSKTTADAPTDAAAAPAPLAPAVQGQ